MYRMNYMLCWAEGKEESKVDGGGGEYEVLQAHCVLAVRGMRPTPSEVWDRNFWVNTFTYSTIYTLGWIAVDVVDGYFFDGVLYGLLVAMKYSLFLVNHSSRFDN